MSDEPLNATGEWKIVDDFEPPVVDHRLRETGNGPTISYEEALLLEYFGEAADDGVYGRPQ